MICYEDYKAKVYEETFKELAVFPKEEVLQYLRTEEAENYIRDNYIHATDENLFKKVHRKYTENDLENFRKGNFIETDIAGTAYGISMMF